MGADAEGVEHLGPAVSLQQATTLLQAILQS